MHHPFLVVIVMCTFAVSLDQTLAILHLHLHSLVAVNEALNGVNVASPARRVQVLD
jgi:hypothetical protein